MKNIELKSLEKRLLSDEHVEVDCFAPDSSHTNYIANYDGINILATRTSYEEEPKYTAKLTHKNALDFHVVGNEAKGLYEILELIYKQEFERTKKRLELKLE